MNRLFSIILMSSGFGSSIPSSKRFPTREKFDTLSSVPPQPSLVHNQLHSLPQMDQAKTIGEKNDDDIDGTSLRSYIIIPRFNDLVGETPFLSIQFTSNRSMHCWSEPKPHIDP